MYPNIGVCILNGLFLVGDHQTQFLISDIWNYLGIGIGFYFANILYVKSAGMESDMGIQATIQTSIALFSVLFDVVFLDVTLSIPNLFGCALIIGSALWVVLLNTDDLKAESINDRQDMSINVK